MSEERLDTYLPHACPAIEGYSWTMDAGLMQTQHDTGRIMQRRKYVTFPHRFNLIYNLTQPEMKILTGFIDGFGYDWCIIRMVSGNAGGPAPWDHRVRFVEGAKARPIGRDLFAVSCVVEMEQFTPVALPG